MLAMLEHASVLDALFAEGDDHFFVHDDAGSVLYASPGVSKRFGIDRAYMRGRRLREVALPLTLVDAMATAADEARLGARAVRAEAETTDDDGTRSWYRVSAARHEPRGATPPGGTVVVRDVTSERRAAVALEHSQARVAALSDASIDGIAIHRDGRVIFASRAFEEMFGEGPGALMGRFLADLVPPDVRASVVAAIGARMNVPMEYTALRRDGTPFPVRVTARTVPDIGGAVRVAVVRDLSNERSALASIAASERRWKYLAMLVPVGVFETDAAGDCTFVNERWQAMTGIRAEDARGRGWLNALHPEDRDRVCDEWYAAASAGREFALEYRYATPAGVVTWVQGSAVALRENGAVTGYVGTATDITERKDADARTAVRERLTSVGRLAAAVAHEVNSPLQYLMTNVELVLEQLRADRGREASALLPAAEEALVEARDGADRVRRIVLGLSTLTRPSDDPRIVLDLRTLLDRAITDAFGRVPHRARVVRRYERAPLVSAGESGLMQVFVNLLSNAAQALPQDGSDGHEITVSTGTYADGRAVVEIRDTGVGISEEDLTRVFDPFFTTRSLDGGTGLGLSVVHSIVTSLGGSITARSEVGRGTTMSVALPAMRGSVPAAREPSERPVEPARGAVLSIDDDALVGTAVMRMLRKEHDVTFHADARDALALIRKGRRFDAILCDLMMPNMTGMEFYETLRAECPEQAERVIFMTGGAFLDGAQQFLDATGNTCLTKPVPAVTLRAAVRDAVERNRRPG